MSTAMIFKCPCCGGYLEFDPSLQKFKCLYCGQVLSEDDLREQSAQRQQAAQEAAAEQPAQVEKLRIYHCQMCGAEVVTTDTTAATRCYYCHSPIVLNDRLDAAFKPDGVVPFKLNKEEALQQFKAYIRKKKFVDHAFFDEAQMEMFSGVYYPFWYCDVEGGASFDGEGTRTSVRTTPRHIVTTTNFFRVRREGRLSFRNIARKALQKADGQLTDGIHPFDLEEMKPYAAGYLSGFLAEKRDVELNALKPEILKEIEGYAADMMRSNHPYNSLRGNTDFRASELEIRYVLLPAWVLTYKAGREGAPYYYMMNGQTGRVCGKLPINKGKLLLSALGLGAAIFAALCAGGMFIW